MLYWITEIHALNPEGHLKKWCGPAVPGISREDAERYCQENGLGYCRVVGILVEGEDNKFLSN